MNKNTRKTVTLKDIKDFIWEEFFEVENFPFNCGVMSIGEFPSGLESIFEEAFIEATSYDDVKNKYKRSTKIQTVTSVYVQELQDFEPKMTVVASLADYQYKEWQPILKAAGFKKVSETKNPNSGNKISIYIRQPLK